MGVLDEAVKLGKAGYGVLSDAIGGRAKIISRMTALAVLMVDAVLTIASIAWVSIPRQHRR